MWNHRTTEKLVIYLLRALVATSARSPTTPTNHRSSMSLRPTSASTLTSVPPWSRADGSPPRLWTQRLFLGEARRWGWSWTLLGCHPVGRRRMPNQINAAHDGRSSVASVSQVSALLLPHSVDRSLCRQIVCFCSREVSDA